MIIRRSRLCILAVFVVACSSDYDRARELYQNSRKNPTELKSEFSEPLAEAIGLLEDFLSHNHDDPQGTLLLWRCYLRTGNPRDRAMHENMLRMSGEMREVLPDEIFDEPDAYMREDMVHLLGEMATTEEVKPLIEILEEDPHPLVKEASARVLAKLKDERAITPLLDKLFDAAEPTRLSTCRSLSAFPHPKVAAALFHLVVDDREAMELRTTAAQSFTEMASSRHEVAQPHLGQLEAIVQDTGQPIRTRLLCTMILAKLGNSSGAALAAKNAYSEDAFVRRLAVITLGQLGDREALDPIKDALRHQDWRLRQEAAQALGRIGEASTLPHLYKLRDDPVEGVRNAAEQSIASIRAK